MTSTQNGGDNSADYIQPTGDLSRRRLLASAGAAGAIAGLGAFGGLGPSTPAQASEEGGGEGCFNVKDFGAKGDGSTDDRPAIQEAIFAAKEVGGGHVLFPPGTYLIDSHPEWGVGLWVDGNDIHLIGFGASVSKLFLADGASAHVIQIVNVSGGSVRHLGIDGNRAMQTNSVHGLRLAGADRWFCEDFFIHDTAAYGIGAQAGVMTNVRLGPGRIEDAGWTAIDIKNKENGNHDIEIYGVHIRRHGRDTSVGNKAGVTLRGNGRIVNCHVRNFGDNATATVGLRLRSGEASEANGFGGHHSSIENCYVVGSNNGGIVSGIVLAGRNTRAVNNYVQWCDNGIDVHQREASVVCNTVKVCGIGIVLRDTGLLTPGKQSTVVANDVENCADVGVKVDTVENVIACNIIRSCNFGIEFTSNAKNNNTVGNLPIASETAQYKNEGNFNRLLADTDIEINGVFDHDGPKAGFFGTTPVGRPNVKPAGEVSTQELAEALTSLGLIG